DGAELPGGGPRRGEIVAVAAGACGNVRRHPRERQPLPARVAAARHPGIEGPLDHHPQARGVARAGGVLLSPIVGRAQLRRLPYRTFTVMRGTGGAAGKSHLEGIGCAAAAMTMAMSADGARKEVADVTVIPA